MCRIEVKGVKGSAKGVAFPIDWNVLLPGIAWRSLILLHALPAAMVVWNLESALG